MEFRSLALVFGTLLVSVHSYPSSVPPTASVCRNMTPGHGPRPLSSSPGCKVTSSTDSVTNGGQIEVTIVAVDPSKPFKGYYLQARDAQNNPIGTFSPTPEAKTHSCGGIKNNAIHHTSGSGKKSISVFWKSPAKYDGVVTFTATCVQDFDNFWTQVKSTPVKVQSSRSRLHQLKVKSRPTKINETFIRSRNHRQTLTTLPLKNSTEKTSRILNHPVKYINDVQPSVNLYLPNEDDEEEEGVGHEKLLQATSNYEDQTTNSVDSNPGPNPENSDNNNNNNNSNNNNGRRRNNRGRNRNRNNNNNDNNNNNNFYYEHSVSFPNSPGTRLGGSVSGGQFQFPNNNFNGGIGIGGGAFSSASASASASASSSSSITSNTGGILNPSSFNFRSDPTFKIFDQQLHLSNINPNPNQPRSSSSFIIGAGGNFPGNPRGPSAYPNYYQFSTNLDGNSPGNRNYNNNPNNNRNNRNRPNSIRDQIGKDEGISNPNSNLNLNQRRPGRNYYNSNIQLSSVNNNFYNDDNKSGLISPPRLETGFRPNFFPIPPPPTEEIIYGRPNHFRRNNRRNSRFFPDGESVNAPSAIPPEFRRGPHHHHHNYPQQHSEFYLPRYGYLIFNPARGPPYYIIPQAREEEKKHEILLNNESKTNSNRIDSNHFRNDKFDKDLNFRQTRTQIIHTTEKNSRLF